MGEVRHHHKQTKKEETIMAKYLIESPHTSEECLRSLDEVLAQGPGQLARYDWGCAAGDHTGWVTVEADTESAARSTVPGFLRGKARIVGLNKFTSEQIGSFHK